MLRRIIAFFRRRGRKRRNDNSIYPMF